MPDEGPLNMFVAMYEIVVKQFDDGSTCMETVCTTPICQTAVQ